MVLTIGDLVVLVIIGDQAVLTIGDLAVMIIGDLAVMIIGDLAGLIIEDLVVLTIEDRAVLITDDQVIWMTGDQAWPGGETREETRWIIFDEYLDPNRQFDASIRIVVNYSYDMLLDVMK